jgi:hypothetical protein
MIHRLAYKPTVLVTQPISFHPQSMRKTRGPSTGIALHAKRFRAFSKAKCYTPSSACHGPIRQIAYRATPPQPGIGIAAALQRIGRIAQRVSQRLPALPDLFRGERFSSTGWPWTPKLICWISPWTNCAAS